MARAAAPGGRPARAATAAGAGGTALPTRPGPPADCTRGTPPPVPDAWIDREKTVGRVEISAALPRVGPSPASGAGRLPKQAIL